MSDRDYHGKEEEKAYEKEEKEDEKSWDEKWRRDPVSAVVWACILIWAGLVLLLDNMGYLAQFMIVETPIEAWALIFIGAALIVYAEVVFRLLSPAYRQAVGGTFIWATILLGIGLSNQFGWSVIFPLVLIAIGLSILLRGFF